LARGYVELARSPVDEEDKLVVAVARLASD
jgi:hypothetical protein